MIIDPIPQSKTTLGGKGYRLTLLKGFCAVPEFFVICFENNEEIYLQENQEKILYAFDANGFEYVAVRSSAKCEDSDIASFAGMFETKLNVTRKWLICAISEIVATAKSERVIEYCNLHHIDAAQIEMHVIVQRMVDSRVSGVCFTKQIDDYENMLIEACWGLGEALVGGSIKPDAYQVNRYSFAVRVVQVVHQKKMLAPFRPINFCDVPFHMRNAKKLRDDQAMELLQTCLLIEEKLGFVAADIEWSFENNKLYILQARPITWLDNSINSTDERAEVQLCKQ